jgi:hypothetical protein
VTISVQIGRLPKFFEMGPKNRTKCSTMSNFRSSVFARTPGRSRLEFVGYFSAAFANQQSLFIQYEIN